MVTREKLISYGVENLSEIILHFYKRKPDIRTQLDMIVDQFESEPEIKYVMIKTDIACIDEELYWGRDCQLVTEEVNEINDDIMRDVLPKSSNQAVELLLKLLDKSNNIISLVDDYDYVVLHAFRSVCADLSIAYEHASYPIEDIVMEVYNRFMSCSDVCENIIFILKDVLGDEGLKLLKQKLEQLEQSDDDFRTKGLQEIADIQNNVDDYIQACYFNGKVPPHYQLEIVKRLIKHSRGKEAIEWLDSIEPPITYVSEDAMMSLKVKALEVCGDYKEAKAEREKWFDIRLSTEVYHEIWRNCEVGSTESWENTAIQKAFEFKYPSIALKFLREIKEYAQAAKFVYKKVDTFDLRDYPKVRPIANKLCENHPLAATLLYRRMIKLSLAFSESVYHAAEDLAVCHSLNSKIFDWQGHRNHQLYFEELSVEYKHKTEFWSLYESALNTQNAKKARLDYGEGD